MSLFLIETMELTDIKADWKTIARSHVIAKNINDALMSVEKQYTKNQYIHVAVSEIELTLDCKIQRHFF